MNVRKIISIIWILSIIISIVPMNAAATPNFDEWGISTDDLNYNEEEYIDVEINTSTLKANTDYYVMSPVYLDEPDFNLTWKKVMAGGSPVLLEVEDTSTTSTQTVSSGLVPNVSGTWVIAEKAMVDGGTVPNGTNFDDLGGFFWVNSSQAYEIELSDDEANYGQNETVTITVNEGNSSVGCWIDVIRDFDGEKIIHRYESDGIYEFSTDWMLTLEWAGEYTVQAYRDLDEDEHGYTDGGDYYSSMYGQTGINADYYNFTNCGAWDPPEHTSEKQTITVNTGEPEVTFYDKDVYWSFDGTINISTNVENLNVVVLNNDYEDVTGYLNVSVTGNDILISNADAESITTGGWGRDALGNTYGGNGTWRIYLFNDTDGDGVEEWNVTAKFKVLSPVAIQWEWIDDDGEISNNDKDGIIPRIPYINEIPINIQFQIIGNDHSYYGDLSPNPIEDYGENITLTGNALFLSTKSLDDFPGVSYSDGTWTVPIIPTMAVKGGKITFNIEWEDYGSFEQDLLIGGTEYNGTIVEIAPDAFVIDEELTVSVDVFGPLGTDYPISHASVELWWLNDNGTRGKKINETDRPDNPGENTYSFIVTEDEQHNELTTLPRKLMAYVNVSNLGCGYTTATMMPMSDLQVSVSQSTIMAGEKTKFTINVTKGNNTEPEGNIQVEFYDSGGEKINLDSDFGSLRDNDLDNDENILDDYILIPGIYTLYAHNATHDSTGQNATFEVKSVDVSCDLGVFIWNVDDNITATFTVLYNESPVDGTLKVINMSDKGDYYSVWVKNGESQFDVINGTATITISADYLPDDKFLENLTFEFSPDSQGSKFAAANGIVPVKVADVSVSPKALPFNSVSNLEITVTGRGTGLSNVLVGIDVPGIPTTLETSTDTNGKAIFAFKAPTTGKIIIMIENRISDKTVLVTSWSLYINAPIQVKEGETFTIQIQNGSADGNEITEALVEFAGNTNVGVYTFTAPSVSSDVEYTMKASLEGYIPASVNILVTNVPVLSVIVENINITIGSDGGTFTITIANDEGVAIIGATIIFNGREYTSSAGGVATLDKPKEEGNYEIIAYKDGFESSSPITITVTEQRTPGFEIVIFIGALFVSLILLRKRR